MDFERKAIETILSLDQDMNYFPTLQDLCGRKLVSDVSIIERICTKVPNTIFYFLLNTAISEDRDLSTSHLLKYYPGDTFSLSLSSEMENLARKGELRVEYYPKEFLNIACTVHSLFMKILTGEYQNSNLRILDLSELSSSVTPLHSLDHILAKICYERTLPEFELRLSIMLFSEHDSLYLRTLKRIIRKMEICINLHITGLYFHNEEFKESRVSDLLDLLDAKELEKFGLQFCQISLTRGDIFVKLKRFYNLRALNIIYTKFNFTKDASLLDTLSETLCELVHLTELSLQECKITGCLERLFQKFCKREMPEYKKQKTETGENCCLAHRAKLRSLNLSGCDLNSDDLMYLTYCPVSKSLENLNLSYCKVDANFIELLTTVSSNLIMLDIGYLLPKYVNLDSVFPVLKSMKKLRLLKLNGLYFDDDYMISKAYILNNMPSLQWLLLSGKPYTSNTVEDFQAKFRKVLNASKCIKVHWDL